MIGSGTIGWDASFQAVPEGLKYMRFEESGVE
jgi:hypothetical protein